MSDVNPAASQELFFLYELAQVLASSIDLAEVTEYILDGTCALLGAEQGFIHLLDDEEKLHAHAARGLDESDLQTLAKRLKPALARREPMSAKHPQSPDGAALAAPLLARNESVGLVGVATVYTRVFTPQEHERLAAVAHLAALALENARLHERAKRELALQRQLIQAAQLMATGDMNEEQAAEFEVVIGHDELSRLGRVFGQMARQVIQREETLRRQVEELNIMIDEVRKARQVAEITETEYFQTLREQAKELREKR